jgi:ABC-type ATPase with predicted acetyltransferase domain
MSEMDPTENVDVPVSVGDSVFNEDGEELGNVHQLINGGLVVSVDVGAGEHQRTTSGEFGEAFLMWRCLECGEMGDIEDIPDRCPNCEAEKESLYYWTED